MTDAIDPRFDPVFQRGYDAAGGLLAHGAAQAPVAAQSVELPPAAARREGDLAPPPPRQSDFASLVSAQQAESAASGAVDAGYPASPLVVTQVLGEQPAQPPSRVPNPFIIVLWLLAAALLAVSYLAYSWAFGGSMFGMGGPQSQEEMMLQQVVWALSPSAVTVGLGAVAGLLFWHATTWRNRNRNRNRRRV